jgi:hypothetical protein
MYQQLALVPEGQIIAGPTGVKGMPQPLRKLVGDLSDQGRVVLVLDLDTP